MKKINSMLECVDTKILSDSETLEQLKKFKKGDMDARDRLIFSNIHLVINFARTNATSEEDFKELFSIGVVALIDSINSYDINKNLNLKDYISKCVELSISSHIQEKNERHSFRVKNAITEGSKNVCLNYEDKELFQTLSSLIEQFDEKQRKIIKLYFGFEDKRYSAKEISKMLNYSESWIISVINSALRQLKTDLAKEYTIPSNPMPKSHSKRKKVPTNC